MKKCSSIYKLKSIFFVLGIFTFNATLLGQTTIVSGSANITGTTTSGSLNAWEDVGASLDISLTGGNKVLVLSTFEVSVSKGNSDLLTQFRLTDGTTSSPQIERYVASKTYNDHGLGAIGYLFNYSIDSTTKHFKLQHSKGTGSGVSKQFTTEAVIIALVLDDNNVHLPSSHKETGDVTTTSTSFTEVTGTKTDAIILSRQGGIYLTTSFSTFGSTDLTGSYVLRSSTDGTNFTEISGASISRTNSTNPGAATISVLMENQPAGTYYFDVAHKTSAGTLTTRNLSLCVVGLVDTSGKVYRTFSNNTAGPVNTTSNSANNAATNTVKSLTSSNKLFVHSTFNMSSSSILDSVGFRLNVTGSGVSFTPNELHRYLPGGGSTGSGGIVGIATGLSIGTDYTVALQHRSDGTNTLSTSNINLVGFQLTSSPSYEMIADGAWNTASNWSTGIVPGAANDVNIPPGYSATIAAGASANCYNIDVSGTLIINSDATSNGSLIVSGSSTGYITYNRYLTGVDIWHLISSPVGGQDINEFVVTNVATNAVAAIAPKYGLASYNNTTPGWNHYSTAAGTNDIAGAGNFIAGKGYEVLRTSDGTLSFTGTVATDNVSIGITKSTSGWNLVGNPFPSAINGNSPANASNNFLTVNAAAIDANYLALYVWDAATSSYLTVNHTYSGNTAFHVAPGQAFFVYSPDVGSTISFNEAMQTHQTGDIFKSGKIANPSIKLIVERSQGTSSTNIKYIDNTTTGLDPGYDAGRFSGGDNSFAVYTHLVGDETNTVDFDIQCLPANDFDQIIPVGLNAPENTEVVFRAETINLPSDVQVFLEDKATGTFTALQVPGSFYSILINAKTEGTGRFYLHTKSAATEIEPLSGNNDFSIIPRPQNNTIRVIGAFGKNSSIAVYDLAGRKLIYRKLNTSTINDVEMDGLISGVYLITISSSTQKVSKKISWIKNQ